MADKQILHPDWLDDDGRSPHDRLNTFVALWGDHMGWSEGITATLNRILAGILPKTDEADALLLEIYDLEKQQKAFSASVQGAENKVINWASQMLTIKDDMDVIEAQATLDCTESNAGKRKAETTLALAKDEKYKETKGLYRDAERGRLIAEAHLGELKRDRGRISNQVWSRRARLEYLTALVNSVRGE